MQLWKDTARGKKRLAAFKLRDISLVDKPAQEHAKIALYKRYDEDKDMKKQSANSPEMFEEKPTTFAAAVAMMAERFPYYSRIQAAQAAQAQYPELYAALPSGSTIVVKANESMPELMKEAHAIQKRDACSMTEAMTRARREKPGLLEEYRHEDVTKAIARREARPLTAAERLAKSEDDYGQREFQVQFENKVNKLAAQLRIPRIRAMAKARKDYPELFENAYGNN